MTTIHIPMFIITIVSLLVIFVIGRKRVDVIINFFLRIGLCFVAIYFVNQALLDKGISVCIAMNAVTFLTCGFLGFPGLFLLYGIAFFSFFVGI